MPIKTKEWLKKRCILPAMRPWLQGIYSGFELVANHNASLFSSMKVIISISSQKIISEFWTNFWNSAYIKNWDWIPVHSFYHVGLVTTQVAVLSRQKSPFKLYKIVSDLLVLLIIYLLIKKEEALTLIPFHKPTWNIYVFKCKSYRP